MRYDATTVHHVLPDNSRGLISMSCPELELNIQPHHVHFAHLILLAKTGRVAVRLTSINFPHPESDDSRRVALLTFKLSRFLSPTTVTPLSQPHDPNARTPLLWP
jgi:hypothetical protein